jgi:hypothetical protein
MQHAIPRGDMNVFLDWITLDCVELDFGMDFHLNFIIKFWLEFGQDFVLDPFIPNTKNVQWKCH